MLSHVKPLILLTHGNIFLFDDAFTQTESLAIYDGRIIASGLNRDILSLATHSTQVIDLKNRTVTPGLIDAHVHIQALSRQLSMIDCETETLDQCLQRIKDKVDETPPDKWILGRGWNQNLWSRFGTKQDLDALTSHHPIYLIAKSGHAAWVNSLALSIAGLVDDSIPVEGGAIQLDSKGKPSGILFENSMKLVSKFVPEMTIDEIMQGIRTVQDRLWTMGLTGLHDFDGPSAFIALQRLYDEHQLGMRVLKNIPHSQLDQAIDLGLRSGFGNDWLRVGNIKIFADGALGPQTAAMIDPYLVKGEERGILLLQVQDLTETILKAGEHGLAVSIHAIGDQANRVVLDAFENVRKEECTRKIPLLRHRIEHLQLLHPDDLDRPAKLNIIASMQPIHATSDMIMADQYWGDRSRYSYAWRSQLDSGARLIFGSDAPIESPNPFLGLYAATTRRRLDGSPGEDGWIPEERISLQEAFLAYTRGPAYAAGLEKELGCLLPGYCADLIVFDENPFECSPERLPYLSPIATMIGGEWKLRNF
jgi:predicted amidohydrolase YtcJ